jgi:hypothetical protein
MLGKDLAQIEAFNKRNGTDVKADIRNSEYLFVLTFQSVDARSHVVSVSLV